MQLFCDIPVKAKFHDAIQSQTRSPTCVYMSCACRRTVESWSKASCEPVCDQVQAISRYAEIIISNLSSRQLVADSHEQLVVNLVGNRVWDQVCDLDSITEFGLNQLIGPSYRRDRNGCWRLQASWRPRQTFTLPSPESRCNHPDSLWFTRLCRGLHGHACGLRECNLRSRDVNTTKYCGKQYHSVSIIL